MPSLISQSLIDLSGLYAADAAAHIEAIQNGGVSPTLCSHSIRVSNLPKAHPLLVRRSRPNNRAKPRILYLAIKTTRARGQFSSTPPESSTTRCTGLRTLRARTLGSHKDSRRGWVEFGALRRRGRGLVIEKSIDSRSFLGFFWAWQRSLLSFLEILHRATANQNLDLILVAPRLNRVTCFLSVVWCFLLECHQWSLEPDDEMHPTENNEDITWVESGVESLSGDKKIPGAGAKQGRDTTSVSGSS